MKSKSVLLIMLVSMLATILIPNAFALKGQGSDIDVIRGIVIKSPDAALLAMQTDEVDFSPDQIRESDITTLVGDGFLMTENLGFHMGYIAYNIRTDQSYRRSVPNPTGFWPLADVDFRHALIHGYDQMGIIPPIYGFIVTPVQSLVPPAQSYWYNPTVETHPFALGNPFTTSPGEHNTVGILLAAGYSFVDAGTIGSVDDADYWTDPDGYKLPQMVIWTPLQGVAPTSYQHGQEFVNDLGSVGLKATTANGNSGMKAEGADFNWYLEQVFDYSNFDGYMVFWGLGKSPDQVYLLCHSDFDTIVVPGANNAPGIDDPELDDLMETMMFSLPPAPGDPDPRKIACDEVQVRLYDPDYDYALTYMLLYSRSYFNAFDQYFDGAVRSPGYGSDNSWTYLNMRWLPGGTGYSDDTVRYVVGDEPDSFNQLYASTVYEWWYIGGTMDSLINVNPYSHADVEWIATDWSLVETGNPAVPMDITYTIRSDVEWQDGRIVTASDLAWCLNFIKTWQIPRYTSIWQFIDSITVHSATSFTVHCTETNWVLLYDLAGIAAYCPPQIWDRTWANQQAVLDYDPTEAYNVASGYTAGPNPPPTNLFGTGAWIFQFYDKGNLYGDLHANPNYLIPHSQVLTDLTEMFHFVGDVNRDGYDGVDDHGEITLAWGSKPGQTRWNANADLNLNDLIEIADMAQSSFYVGWYKEYDVSKT